jgi:cyanate permease
MGMPVSKADADRRSPVRFRDLVQDRRLATLSSAFALGLFAQIGLIAHLLARLAPAMGETSASAVVSLATGCAIVGRLLLASLRAEQDRRRVAAGNFAMQAAGTLLLALGAGPVPLVAGAVLFGLGIGNLFSLPPLIAQAEFGRADVARIVALVTAVNQAVFAFAPALFGALHDLFGSYGAPFACAAAMQLIAGCVILAGGSYRRPREEGELAPCRK